MSPCDQLTAFLDRTLEGEERSAFERHAQGCPRCRGELAAWSALEQTVREVAGPATPFVPSAERRRALVRSAEGFERRRPSRGWVFGAVALAAAVAVGFFFLRRPAVEGAAPERLALTVTDAEGNVRDVPSQAARLSASDESPVSAQLGKDRLTLAKRSRLVVLQAQANLTRLGLEGGTVAASVQPRTPGSFAVEAGDVTVLVKGTRFSVAREGGLVRVAVSEGTVAVRWGTGKEQLVTVGRRLDVRGDEAREEALGPRELESLDRSLDAPFATPAAGPEASAPAPIEPTETEPAETEPAPASAPRHETRGARATAAQLAGWRRGIVDGRYDEIEKGIAAHLKRSPTDAEALSLLADARRKAGKWKEAVSAYQRVVDLGAPVPANRARLLAAGVLQDELGDHQRALPLLQAYLAQGAETPSLEAAAILRLARSQRAIGQRAEAKANLERLVRDFPDSGPAIEARRLLAE